MKQTKVNSIEEILNGDEIIEDLSNLDLEGIDLSSIPEEKWYFRIFDNTSVKGTGIKLDLSFIKGKHSDSYGFENIYNCDFSYNDYVYYEKGFVNFYSCNFKNTNISSYIYGKDNELDLSCTSYEQPLNYQIRPILDIKTIYKNPQLNFKSRDLLLAMKDYLQEMFPLDLSNYDIENVISIIEDCFKYDKEGKLIEFYNFINKYLNKKEVITVFRENKICNKKFKDIDLTDMDTEISVYMKFQNCTFENIICKKESDDLFYMRFPIYSDNIINNVILPSIHYDSWKTKPKMNRIVNSKITFKTNLYLELSRDCNANCLFCRNNFYCNDEYDLDKIVDNLNNIIPYIDSIVVGGGEPTLRLNDLEYILKKLDAKLIDNRVDKYIFTNGSLKYVDNELSDYIINYNISRHAIDDYENANIFGLDKNEILSGEELKSFIKRNKARNITLAATCFKGGLDSKEKIIDYIKYALKIKCKNILLSDLIVMEADLLNNKGFYNINIDNEVFKEVIKYLESNGFIRTYPIYSTGGYMLTILKKDNLNISFKHYISKGELEDNWQSAMKRTFDLSIDPKGDLYENWHQTSGLVKKFKK